MILLPQTLRIEQARGSIRSPQSGGAFLGECSIVPCLGAIGCGAVGAVDYQKRTKMSQLTCLHLAHRFCTGRLCPTSKIELWPQSSENQKNLFGLAVFRVEIWVMRVESHQLSLYSSKKHGRKAKVGVIDNRCSFQPLSLQICPVTSDWLGIGSRCTREAP